MRKIEGLTIEEKAMMVIEDICLHADPDDRDERLSLIYRISHTANAPDCRKNHPAWTKEIERLFEEIMKSGL